MTDDLTRLQEAEKQCEIAIKHGTLPAAALREVHAAHVRLGAAIEAAREDGDE